MAGLNKMFRNLKNEHVLGIVGLLVLLLHSSNCILILPNNDINERPLSRDPKPPFFILEASFPANF